VSGYFKRMAQLAQVNAAPANRSSQLQNHNAVHAQADINTFESATVSADSHPPMTMPNADSYSVDAFQSVIQERAPLAPYQRSIDNTSIDSTMSRESRMELPAAESAVSKKSAVGPNTLVEYPKLSKSIDVEPRQKSTVDAQPEQKVNRESGSPAVEFQSTSRSEHAHSQVKSGIIENEQRADLPQSRTEHRSPNSVDSSSVPEQVQPASLRSHNAAMQSVNEEKNRVADVSNSQRAPAQTSNTTKWNQYSEDILPSLQQSQPRVSSPIAPSPTSTKVDVKIGSITLTTDPETPKEQPKKTVRSTPAPRTNGVWSSGRSFSRAYVRRS